MKFASIAALLLASTAASSTALAKSDAISQIKLERVVMLMRHGIRPPTSATPAPKTYNSENWPSWSVDYGLLTQRGAAGVKLLGEADRAYYIKRGLFGTDCPAPGSIVLKASSKQRAIKTAESWGMGFAPGCTVAPVDHPGDKDPDPIFHGFDDNPASFDGQRAYREALALAPKGGVAAEAKAYRAELLLMKKALGCTTPACPIFKDHTTLVSYPHDRPELEGPLDIGSTVSQTFLLQYLEGMPMKDVGWGRVTRREIEQMLRFHPLKFKYSNSPDYIARSATAPLANELLQALDSASSAKLTLLAGHDTNIADMAGFLRVHWTVPSYPADDVPPGSAIGFELLGNGKGDQYVRVFYRAQTMDQLREQRPLTGKEAPFRQYLAIPGCGNSIAATACTFTAFKQLVKSRVAL